ncbi:MAG: hypothetical protein K8H85_06200 [Cyclobacteriaceae bacterium]|jgi:hypothetical protein|nr:hypothetical protein [Cyclobacteriaceae bacterium]
MTSGPVYPIILIDNSSGYLDIIYDGEDLTNSNVLGLVKGVHKNFIAYDKDGLLWIVDKVDSHYKITGLTKILAHTVYNPQIKVTLNWTKRGEYTLKNLKKDINKQVDSDDDIITQFNEADFIKRKIEKCDSFSEIVEELNNFVFKESENESLN